MSKNIIVSDVVAKVLTESNRTAEDVLREALKIKPEGFVTAEGVVFPEGTAFMAWYKDRAYWANVKNGMLEFMGKSFSSVSAAAMEITKRPANGWEFWQAKVPGKSDFIKISKLRTNV